jgi:hypothetical protein
MVELLEVVGVEVVKERRGPDGLTGDGQIVNMRIPVSADVLVTHRPTTIGDS